MQLHRVLALLVNLYAFVACDGVFYELKSRTTRPSNAVESCTGVAQENKNIDILCMIKPPADTCRNLSAASIKWYFASTTSRVEITEGEKYGIWDEMKYEPTSVASLLRVRAADQDKDRGVFTCSLYCPGSSEPVGSHKIETCVKDGAINLVSCSQSTTEDVCTHVFKNGVCDQRCESEDQLFDGGDCDSYREESCTTEDCLTSYGNGVCNRNCSSSQCGFDGGDCLTAAAQSVTREMLTLVIPTAHHTVRHTKDLSRKISILLSTLVRPYGKAVLWTASDNKDIYTTYMNPAVFQLAQDNLTMLQYTLVPQACSSERCFHRVKNAAKYISHHLSKDPQALNNSVAVIGIHSNIDDCDIRDRGESPNGNGVNNIASKPPDDTLETGGRKLKTSEIVGIALFGVSLLLLVLGVTAACRYRSIALSRQDSQAKQKQSQVKAYIDNILTDFSSDGGGSSDSPKSPQSSISRSVTSKDTILPKTPSRTHNYGTTNDGGGSSYA